jgi:hypothetical protein
LVKNVRCEERAGQIIRTFLRLKQVVRRAEQEEHDLTM